MSEVKVSAHMPSKAALEEDRQNLIKAAASESGESSGLPKTSEAESGEQRNLSCYTPPGSTYPPYISINYVNTMVEITVRSPEGEDRSCGSLAKIRMNRFHFHKLIDEAKAALR